MHGGRLRTAQLGRLGTPYLQNGAHDISRWPPRLLAELVEALQVLLRVREAHSTCLVERVADHFNVQLVKILLGDTAQEKRRCTLSTTPCRQTERRVDEDRVVELRRCGGN